MERGGLREMCAASPKEEDAGAHGSMPSAEAQRNLSGVSEDTFEALKSSIKVSNADGYLCHISSETTLPCPPWMTFAILTNPDNTGVFRDIKGLGYRKVLRDKPDNYKIVEVEQRGEVRVLWHRFYFSTFLTVTEDGRDPHAMKASFALIKSDVLSKFQGTWTIYPGSPAEEAVEGHTTRVCLEQDVLPVGVPAFMAQMPVLGHLLRGICTRTVRRLLEDVHGVIKKVQSGIPLEAALTPAGQPGGMPPQRPKVDSHAVDDFSESDDEAAGESEEVLKETKQAADVRPDQGAPTHAR